MGPMTPEEAQEFQEKQTQNCCNELLELFNDMKYALYFGLGGHALEHLIQWVLDKYPLTIRIEALTRVQNELERKMAEMQNNKKES